MWWKNFKGCHFFLQSIGLLRRAPQKYEFLRKEYVAQKNSSNGFMWAFWNVFEFKGQKGYFLKT